MGARLALSVITVKAGSRGNFILELEDNPPNVIIIYLIFSLKVRLFVAE